jgi:hypothetical protein
VRPELCGSPSGLVVVVAESDVQDLPATWFERWLKGMKEADEMVDDNLEEIRLLADVYKAVRMLKPEARLRVLRYVSELLGDSDG